MQSSEEQTMEQEEDTQKGKFLIFNLQEEFYGIEIKYVTEIIKLQPITEVPELPKYIKGIINLRGEIIPVMDVRTRFKKPFREYNDRTCVIVVDVKNIHIGLIVDSVIEVINIPEVDIVPPPRLSIWGNKYIKGVGKAGEQVKLILDCCKILSGKELVAVANLEEEKEKHELVL